MAERYNYQVTGASWISEGTPAALARTVRGSLEIVSHDPLEIGAGGQLWTRKGAYEATVSLSCVGMVLADQQLWFPTSAGVQVASFKDMLVEVDDGTSGREWVLSEGQPASIQIAVSEAMDGYIAQQIVAKYALVTPQAIGTDVCVYNSVNGHTINDTRVTGGAADIDCLSFELSNDLGITPNNPMNERSAGSKTAIDGYFINPQAGPGLSFVTGGPLWGGTGDELFDDAWTDVSYAIALANGTAGENISYALSEFTPRQWNMGVGGDHSGFAHVLAPAAGTVYNRVVLS